MGKRGSGTVKGKGARRDTPARAGRKTAGRQGGKGAHGEATERRDEAPDNAAERAAESSAAPRRYAEMRARGKTVRQIRAVAVARDDEDLVELCDGVIAGTRAEPGPEAPEGGDSEAGGGDGNEGGDADNTGNTETASEGGGGDGSGDPENIEDAESEGGGAGEDDEGGGGESEAEDDPRPAVTREELRAVDVELSELAARVRGASADLNRLRETLAGLQRTRRAMGPVERERRGSARTGRDPNAPRRPSLLTGAAGLLAEAGEAMNCRRIVQELDERGIWTSPAGRTPDATLYAGINREIIEKGGQSRFVRMGKGQYAASEYGRAQYRAAHENAAAPGGSAGTEDGKAEGAGDDVA